jgi:hypothetical protein
MCQSRQAPKLCFPAHTAPLDIKFNANGTAAYVPFHGSWNKSPADGFRLSRVAFNPATGMPVDASTSTTAAVNIMVCTPPFPSSFTSLRLRSFSMSWRSSPQRRPGLTRNQQWNANTAACPNRCFRPVNVVFGTAGLSSRLFMTSDTTNEIWVIGGAT